MGGWSGSGGGGGGSPLVPTFAAKGDTLIGTGGAGVHDAKAVGADGTVLIADSSQADGVRWATPQAAAVFPLFMATNTQTPAAATYTAGAPLLLNANWSVADLTGYTLVSFCVLTPSQWDAGVKIRPQWSSDAGATWNYMEAAGTGLEMAADVNDSGTSLIRQSGYVLIAAGAAALIATRIVLYGTVTATAKGTKTALLAK